MPILFFFFFLIQATKASRKSLACNECPARDSNPKPTDQEFASSRAGLRDPELTHLYFSVLQFPGISFWT